LSNRPQCPPDEDILRAITTADWDEREGRVQASFFAHDGKGDGVSVSRLQVLSREQLLRIFSAEFQPPRLTLGTAEINVGVLQALGREFKPAPTELTVEQDPTPTNPAHALIPQKITRGLSNHIRRYLEESEAIKPLESA
jgi:hypothetical protein